MKMFVAIGLITALAAGTCPALAEPVTHSVTSQIGQLYFSGAGGATSALTLVTFDARMENACAKDVHHYILVLADNAADTTDSPHIDTYAQAMNLLMRAYMAQSSVTFDYTCRPSNEPWMTKISVDGNSLDVQPGPIGPSRTDVSPSWLQCIRTRQARCCQ